MTARKLTKEELKELLNFIEKRGFKYIDVQLEILDHFACKVEEILTKEPEISLSLAMEKAHASFGIFGFSTIEDAYAGGLNRRFFNELPGKWISLAKIPRGILIVTVFAVFAYLLFSLDNADFTEGSRWGLASSFLIATIATLFQYRPLSKNYLIYRNTAALYITILAIMLQLLANPGLWSLVGETGSKVLILALLCVFGSFFMLLETKLKKVVERVDEMQLQTRYS